MKDAKVMNMLNAIQRAAEGVYNTAVNDYSEKAFMMSKINTLLYTIEQYKNITEDDKK